MKPYQTIDPKIARSLFDLALEYSYYHICQIFGERGNREKTDKSYNEIMGRTLSERGHKLLTVIHRPIINERYDLEHYEFGVSTPKYFIEIRVKPEWTKAILQRFELEP